MSRRRPGISAGNSAVSWAAKHMTVADAPGQLAPQPTAVPPRIAHPVVDAPFHKCYRVIRRYFIGDSHIDTIEDIGAFRSPAPAMAMLNREEGRAQVLDRDGKVYADNLRKMERR